MAVLALIPFVRAILLWRQGWVPLGDNANIAIRGADFGTTDTPLLGMPSGLVGLAPGTNSTHPGPLVFWVIGPWVRVFGYHALPVLLGAAAVGSAATCAILWCARRQAGARGLVAAAGVLTMITVLVGYNLVQPLNPAMALLPALAALVAAAAVVSGNQHAIPVLAAAASFAAQAESAYTPIMVVVVLAVTLFWWGRRATRSLSRRVWGITALLVALSWIGPLLDMVANGGGNVRETLRASSAADLQPQGWPASRAAVQSVFHPVGWVTSLQDGAPSTGFGAVVLLVVVLLALGALARWGLRQDPRSVRALLAVGGVAVVATAGSQALTPGTAGRQDSYLLPVVVTGAFIWYSAGIAALDLVRRAKPGRLTRVGMAAAVGLVAAAMTVARLAVPLDLEPGSLAVVGLTGQVDGSLGSGPYLLIPGGGSNSQSVLRGVGFYLEGDGIEVRYPQDQVNFVGADRVAAVEPRRLDALLITRPIPVKAAPEGWRLVADWSPTGVDRAEQSALRSAVAGAMRRGELQFTHQAATFQIGQVLAATGGDDPASLTDQDHLIRLGEDLRAHPDRMTGLSDLTLATMLEEQVLQDDTVDDGLVQRFREATAEDALQLWVVPADR